jgi:hypothetical protein
MTTDHEEIHVGDIVVSSRERRLVAGGREIDVTAREFEIFATMAAHPGWVYGTEQLCSADPESNSSPGAVNVHIAHLRRKLAEAGFPDVIATVRGAGYVVRAGEAGPSPGVEWPPFLGRTKEIEALLGAVADARAGRGRLVLVSGEAGIGKTTLVEHALSATSGGPLVIVRAVCDADGAPQYWLWRQLMLGLPPRDSEPADWEVVRYLTGGSGPDDADALVPPAGRAAVHDALLRFLDSSCAGPTPVVFFVDDIQWAHESSLALLRYVLQRMAGMHLLVAVTCREEDLVGNERLALFVADACSSGNLLHLRLGGLDPDSVASIVAGALGERAGDVARRILALTGGNPLFVRELVEALAEASDEQALDREFSHLPPTIDALVGARVAGLPERTREVLATAAAVGVTFDAEIVGRATGRDGGVVADLEPALASLFIVEAATPGRYRFRHPLFRQALYEGLTVPERQEIHARVYEVVRRSPQSHARRIFELAHHASLAGPDYSGVAVGCLAAAERESFRRYGYEEASACSERALRILDATSFSPETASKLRAVLLERLGESRSAEGAVRAALASYQAALGERRHDERAARARLYTRIAAAQLELGEFNESRSSLELADAALEAIGSRSDQWWAAWIYARLQRAEYEFDTAEDAGTARDPELAAAVAAHASPAQRVSFLEKRAAALWNLERFAPSDACLEAAREAADVAASRPMEYAHARAVELLGGVLVWRRDLQEAEAVLDDALNLMRRCQDPIGETNVLFFRTVASRFANEVDLTEARAAELLEHATDTRMKDLAAAAKGCQAWAALRREQPEVAEGLAREGMAEFGPVGPFPYAWTAAWPLAACALAAGRLDEAASCATAMLDERQEQLAEAISRPLRGALDAYGAGDPVAAITLFSEAEAQAALLGYA